jgi:tetratricopeptide (TPR) repeat protein
MEFGNLPLAHDRLERALTLAGQISHQWYVAYLHNEKGGVLLRQEEWEAAREDYRKARDVAHRITCRDLEAFALFGWAKVEAACGELGEAVQRATKSLSIFREIGHFKKAAVLHWLAQRLLESGETSFRSAEYSDARERLLQARELLLDVQADAHSERQELRTFAECRLFQVGMAVVAAATRSRSASAAPQTHGGADGRAAAPADPEAEFRQWLAAAPWPVWHDGSLASISRQSATEPDTTEFTRTLHTRPVTSPTPANQ